MEINSAQKIRIAPSSLRTKTQLPHPDREFPRPPLADLQRWLRWLFTDPRGVATALADPEMDPARTRLIEPQPRLLDVISEDPPLAVDQRLGVYAEAYFLRLLECLGDDFPATRRALGDDFRFLAVDYLMEHPSSSPNVNDLGEVLPAFISTHRFAQECPFLPELTRLEREVQISLYTDRLPPLNSTELQAVPQAAWANARPVLDPTVRLMTTDWPVDKLWERRRLPDKKGGNRVAKKAPRQLLIYRDDTWVQLRVIDPPRLFALRRLQEGASLEALCQELINQFPDRAESMPVMDWFMHWIRAGVIKKIEF